MQKDPRVKKAYVCLDSRYGKFSDDRKHITWNFENSLIESDNSTNVSGKIQNIVAMRLYSVMTTQTLLNIKRTTFLIEEFAAQSFILPNGRRFHFVGLLNDITTGPIDLGVRNTKTDGASLRVRDLTLQDKYEFLSGYKFNDGIYRFNNPIKHVDTLTLSMSDPFNLLRFYRYELSNVMWTITQINELRLNLIFSEPHTAYGTFLDPTFSIFVDGLIAPDLQYVADYINSAEHTIWEILNDYTISIKLFVGIKAGTLKTTPIPKILIPDPIIIPSPVQPVTVRFNSRRVVINIEFDYLTDELQEMKYSIREMSDLVPKSENSKLKYRYLMLDSDNAYDALSTASKFTWLLNDKVPTLTKGYINVTNPLHNIVRARLGRMTFNNMETSFIADVNNRHRYGFGFEEFASQALITPLGTKYQFIEFLPEYDAATTYDVTLSPFNTNRGWFRFREKINILDKLTLTINNLITDTTVTVPSSRPRIDNATQTFINILGYFNVISYYNGPSTIQVELSGFTTDDPIADAALIAAYNTTHTLYKVGVSSVYYQCPIDISGATFNSANNIPILVTYPVYPRFVGVLELLCDDDDSNDSLTIAKLNPIQQYRYSYLLLDTNNIDVNLSTDTKFGWNYIPNTTLNTGTVNSTTEIRNLIGMRVFPVTSRFIAPVIETGKVPVNDITNMGYNFTILIHEFSAQSFSGRNGFKYHFVLYPQLMNPVNAFRSTSYTPADPYFEYTTSGKGNGWFWFRKPITTFSTLTISMGNPFDLIKQSNVTRVLIPIQFVFLG